MTLRALLCSLLLILPAATASAVTIDGPAWPAPGGTGFTISGDGIGNDSGNPGQTIDYFGFDPSQYDQLWFGLWWPGPPQLSMKGGTSSANDMSFTGNTAATATWQGVTDFETDCNTGCTTFTNVPTRYTMTLSGATWEAATNLLTTDPGFDTGLSVVAEITGDFSMNRIFEVFWDGSWQPALDLFDAEHTPPTGGTGLSVGTGFYSTVPEPGTGLLAMLGLGVFAARRRSA